MTAPDDGHAAPAAGDLQPSDRARIAAKLARAATLIRRLDAAARDPSPNAGPSSEPIAILSLAGRFPGAPDVEALAANLAAGRNAVGPIPPDRFDAGTLIGRGSLQADAGGFLDDVDAFDAEFFAMTPAEAAALDPQHRLALELTLEAIERAAIAPSQLRGTNTGVWLGLSNNDYGTRRLRSGDFEALRAYDFTGNIAATAAGAIAYRFDLTGPAMVVDTACSSSLVAIAEAVFALRARRVDAALAGGVNLILDGTMQVALTKLGALSPRGRCATFDADADGYVRGEGVAMVLLKRLADATADGDPILAVIRGAAVNQDGRSNGFSAPNGAAQRAVIQAALADAGVEPCDVAMVEAHGTGTRLGDPVEMDALRQALGDDGPPVAVSAVKSSVGHLEAAAGVTGLAKLVASLRRGSALANLHRSTPNPHIEWGRRLRPADEAMPLTRRADGSLIGGVSSFGVSGTNAHLVVEVPAPTARDVSPERPALLLVSARSRAGLANASAAFAVRLEDGDASLAYVAYSALLCRDHHPHRAAVVAADRLQARAALARSPRARRTTQPRRASPRASRASPSSLPARAPTSPAWGSVWRRRSPPSPR